MYGMFNLLVATIADLTEQLRKMNDESITINGEVFNVPDVGYRWPGNHNWKKPLLDELRNLQ